MRTIQNLWISGYRAFELQIFKADDPKQKVLEAFLVKQLLNYCDQGLQWVLTGGYLGVEQAAVRAVQDPSLKAYQLKTAVILPFEGIADRWKEENRQTYAQTLHLADYHNSVSHQSYHTPQQFKNWQQFMLTHTDGSFLIYDLEHPGKSQYEYQAIQRYQQQHDYSLHLASFYDLQDFVTDQQEF